MFASQDGHTATAQLLVEAGADKDATNEVRDNKRVQQVHGQEEEVLLGLWT